jgi:hypothetical protein
MAADDRTPSAPYHGIDSGSQSRDGATVVGGTHDGTSAPASALDGLVDRVLREGEHVVFEVPVIDAALALRREAPMRFERLRTDLKRAKVSVRRWEQALDVAQRSCSASSRRGGRTSLRADATRDKLRESAATTSGDAATLAHLDTHFSEVRTDDDMDITYGMRPGQIWIERPTRSGTERITLAHFSALIVESVHEIDAPDAEESVTFALDVVLDGETTPRRREVRATDFDAMRWPGVIAAGAALGSAAGTRERLAEAIRLLSRGVTKRTSLMRYTGWDFRQRIYLTAGASIDEKGDVDGVRVEPQSPADTYAFPPLGDAAMERAGAEALVALLAMEPASVIVPLVGLAARSVLGPSRSIVHLMGRQGLGKSTLAALIAMCFGPAMVKERAPLSWDRVTPLAALHSLAAIGHAVVPIEDLRAEHLHKADPVLRAVFNGAGGVKGKRDGGVRHEPRPRASVLSTGEVRLPGASLNTRVLTLSLDTHPTPRPDAVGGLYDRASNGDLARGMAAFVRWVAPHVEQDFSRIIQRERTAARSWELGGSARAEEVLGALALGLDALFAHLDAVKALDASSLASARRRAVKSMQCVAREHEASLAIEDPARRFCALIGAALRAGDAHVAGLTKGKAAIPAPPTVWGYRAEPSSEGIIHRPQGRRVGYVNASDTPQEVLLDPAVALAVAREQAQRSGYPLSGDASGLARALKDAGLLSRTALEEARKSVTVRVRIGSGVRVEALAVKVEALGIQADRTTEQTTPEEAPEREEFDL